MATQEKRGWVWTPEEKEWIKTWQRKLQNQYDKMLEQLRLHERQLPQFVGDAKAAARPFLEACKPLLDLDGRRAGRKYQNISPEEAMERLKGVNSTVEEWNRFATRGDVSGAARDLRDEHQERQHRAASELAQWLGSTAFDRDVDEWLRQVTMHLNMWVGMLHGENDEGNLAVLRRLALVHFIRFTYEGNERRAGKTADIVRATPAPPITDVLRTALAELIRDTATEYLKKGFPLPGDTIQAYLAGTCTGLDQSVKDWKKSGTQPGGIPNGYFTIQGVDYSVAAKPS
jgi:hypothetical protein